MIQGVEWIGIIIAFIVFLLFGPKALRKLAWSLGRAKKIYEEALKTELTKEEKEELKK